jgi:hypothetical protein
MRGDTTTIDVAVLRLQWCNHSAMASICHYWGISKDQLIRLRDVHSLPKRHSRVHRHKPDREPEPPKAENIASQQSLSLAPAVEKRAAEVRATWTDAQRLSRYWQRPSIFTLQRIELPFDVPPEAEDGLQGVKDDLPR